MRDITSSPIETHDNLYSSCQGRMSDTRFMHNPMPTRLSHHYLMVMQGRDHRKFQGYIKENNPNMIYSAREQCTMDRPVVPNLLTMSSKQWSEWYKQVDSQNLKINTRDRFRLMPTHRK